MNDVIFHEFHWHTNCNFHVYVYPRDRIEVHTRNGVGEVVNMKVFRVGDRAEYDSFNLSYTGEIVSITGKNVIIKPDYNQKTKRLDFYAFSWRNHNFDLVKIREYNHMQSQYI